ncbi:MAG: hypothetical protein OXP28_15825, partial [Gammaproteobacteria bacterium]|nr:hypothetical protein [Gammaproteobacteria bacterium]
MQVSGQRVHAEVLDSPGIISWGSDLDEARKLLSSALVHMAELNLERGEPLPQANAAATVSGTIRYGGRPMIRYVTG